MMSRRDVFNCGTRADLHGAQIRNECHDTQCRFSADFRGRGGWKRSPTVRRRCPGCQNHKLCGFTDIQDECGETGEGSRVEGSRVEGP